MTRVTGSVILTWKEVLLAIYSRHFGTSCFSTKFYGCCNGKKMTVDRAASTERAVIILKLQHLGSSGLQVTTTNLRDRPRAGQQWQLHVTQGGNTMEGLT